MPYAKQDRFAKSEQFSVIIIPFTFVLEMDFCSKLKIFKKKSCVELLL